MHTYIIYAQVHIYSLGIYSVYIYYAWTRLKETAREVQYISDLMHQ